ncbi:hypothetical protein BT69DRAFT_1317341 [Atractiella rhizophila]|nr:hypothetical protein BT69DRAFT_1317341 [Atractiella rhizophila]
MVLLNNPTISLELPYGGAFLHPSSDTELPSAETVYSAKCILTLPKPRQQLALPEIVITLRGFGTVASDNLWEEWTPIDKELRLPASSKLFAPGEYTFEFSFIIPASSAPYDRGQYGRVYHKLTAIAKGVGMFGSNISSEALLPVVVNPTPENCTPAGLSLEVQDIHDEVGPYLVSALSRNMMVAGVIVLGFSLAAPPSRLHIFTVTWSILQTYHLKFPKSKTESHPPPQTRIIWRVGETPTSLPNSSSKNPYMTLEAGEEFILVEQKRLPNDNQLRPSTFPGTNTPINVSHQIVFQCHYAVDGGPRKILEIRRPVDIASCCIVLDDSLILPEYRQTQEVISPKKEDCCLCLLDERAMAKKYQYEIEPLPIHDRGSSSVSLPKYEYEPPV